MFYVPRRAIIVGTLLLGLGLLHSRACRGQPASPAPSGTPGPQPTSEGAGIARTVPRSGLTLRLAPGVPGTESGPGEVRVPPGGRDLSLTPELAELIAG